MRVSERNKQYTLCNEILQEIRNIEEMGNSSAQNFALAAKSVQKSVGRKRIQLIDKSPLAGAGCLKPQLYWPDAL